jgi:hypothetical protein
MMPVLSALVNTEESQKIPQTPLQALMGQHTVTSCGLNFKLPNQTFHVRGKSR